MTSRMLHRIHQSALAARAAVAGAALAAAVAAGAAFGPAGCNRNSQAGPPPRPAAPVTVAEAVAGDVPLYLDEIGNTAPFEYVNVQPQVSGRIDKIHFVDGAEVAKGDPLFSIDPRPFEAAVAQADANLKQQQAALQLAGQEFERVKGLIKNKSISQEEFDQRRNAVAVADAMEKAAQAALRTATLSLEYCTINAPINGRAGKRLVDEGNIVKANENSLLEIRRLDPIYADFTVTERDLPEVRRHMAEGTLTVLVWAAGDDLAAGPATRLRPGRRPSPPPCRRRC